VYAPFFVLAARSPTRQIAFRRVVAGHLLLLAAGALVIVQQGPQVGAIVLGHLLLCAGIVEGAVLAGWRLTQLPRSQALEFLLVSPVRPRQLFRAEAAVGLTLLGLVTLSGLPVLMILAACGGCDILDVLPLTVMPFTWGAIAGLGLTVWAYEAKRVRRWGEVVMLGLVVAYLVVGVLAGEKLRDWLNVLPEAWRVSFLRGFTGMHTHNPFGAMRHWLENDIPLGWERLLGLEAFGLTVLLLLLWRGAARLQAHFHERHYEPARDVRTQKRPPVGDRPLAWWAVKRVTEYSGRINIYLAGGFCLLYAVYIVAGENWPAWLGRIVFVMCDNVGGAAGLAAALVVLAAVPAAFQYGLWDASTQDRCRRLELLLLTHLAPRDYWDAAAAAAWRRGRGYFLVAIVLWAAALAGGRLDPAQAANAIAAGVLLWGLYFALGFRAFVRGAQAGGLGMLLTVGLPLGAFALTRLGWPLAGACLPPGMVYRAGAGPVVLAWLVGPILTAGLALLVTRRSLAECDARLRRWYDQHHGSKVMN
jgi:hypothetical protein